MARMTTTMPPMTPPMMARRAPVLLMLLVVLPAAPARGEQVGFWFEAEDAAKGYTLSGRFSYDTEMRPLHVFPSPDGGAAEFLMSRSTPVGVEVAFDGYTYAQVLPMGYGVYAGELVLVDSDPGTGADSFNLRFPISGGDPDYRYPSFTFRLADRDGIAFDDHLRLPPTLDFSLFEVAEMSFRPFRSQPYVSGAAITSLTPGAPPVLATSFPAPEPGSAVMVALGLGLAGMGAMVRRHRHRPGE